MLTPEMLIRAATAKLNAGGHIHTPATREEFASEMLTDSFGTVTTKEIDSLYAEQLDFWEAVKAVPGVELTPAGCAHKPGAEAAAEGYEAPQDLHAAGDADPAMPDTVEALLNAANHNGPRVVLTIRLIETPDGYGAALDYNDGLNMEHIGATIAAIGEQLKTVNHNDN